MEVKATYRYARISPLKVRDVAREVQGLPVSSALDILQFTPRKAAFLVGKTLKSAIANAENNHELSADSLVVKSATVSEGPVLKRWKPRARGGAAPIRKRLSHINIILSDEITIETREPKKKSKPAAPVAKKEKAAPKKKEEAPAAKEEKEEKVAVDAPAGGRQDEKLGLVYDEAPAQADDLKKISGVGEVLEGKLNENGIYTYEQIAAWTEAQIEEFEELLSFKDRVKRDDWVAQARKLAEEK